MLEYDVTQLLGLIAELTSTMDDDVAEVYEQYEHYPLHYHALNTEAMSYSLPFIGDELNKELLLNSKQNEIFTSIVSEVFSDLGILNGESKSIEETLAELGGLDRLGIFTYMKQTIANTLDMRLLEIDGVIDKYKLPSVRNHNFTYTLNSVGDRVYLSIGVTDV